MKVLYIDAVGGASGDMLAGAMLALDWPLEQLQRLIAIMGLGDEVSVSRDFPLHNSIRASRLEVSLHAHEHAHSEVEGGHHHHQRGLSSILGLLERLPQEIGQPASRVFQRLAQAEALVHGVSVDDIHFHEVGAVDAIVDVVAFCAALAWLRPERIICSPLPLGRGFVDCAHGRLPLPAPAVLHLLEQVPVCPWPEAEETVTPTGAALLSTLAHQFAPMPAFTLLKTGVGGGLRPSGAMPNIVRLMLGQSGNSGPYQRDSIVELQCNIDNQMAEDYPCLSQLLMGAGALDVSASPLLMKKGRPGLLLRVLSRVEQAEEMAALLLEQGTSLGVRMQLKSRCLLPRRIWSMDTPWGEVRIKGARLPNGQWRSHPEAEDVLAVSRKTGMSPALVREKIYRLMPQAEAD